MANQPKELFGSAIPQLPNLRAFPAEDGIAVQQLEQLGADADVAHLTPLFESSGTWGIWADADATVDGFLWAPGEAHAGLDSGETNIQVFKAGVIHADDIPLPSGQTLGTLQTALRSQAMRDQGIVIQGLVSVA